MTHVELLGDVDLIYMGRLGYIFTNHAMTLGWTQMGTCILEIQNLKYGTYKLTVYYFHLFYTMLGIYWLIITTSHVHTAYILQRVTNYYNFVTI